MQSSCPVPPLAHRSDLASPAHASNAAKRRRNRLAFGVLGAAFAAMDLTAQGLGLGEQPDPGDQLGAELVSGDFNGDGIADLAMGVPGESVTIRNLGSSPTYVRAGAVHVLYGSIDGSPTFIGPAGGLSTLRRSFLHQPEGGSAGIANGNAFGAALACGDFDHDGFDDLAVGVPHQTLGSLRSAGAVIVFPGSPRGVDPRLAYSLTQATIKGHELVEAGDTFGATLASGDFNGDSFADLAIGVPHEDLPGARDAGAVNVAYGSPVGLVGAALQSWAQGQPLVEVAEAEDRFGLSLAAGDFNGDGFADLAVGVPFETHAQPAAGLVHVIHGSASGLVAAGNHVWHQDSPEVAGVAEADDQFGAALSAGDYDGDGIADLAIGVPFEITGGIRGGGVNVLFGGPAGPSSAGNLLLTQDHPLMFDEIEPGDRFGARLSSWRPRPGDALELAIGIPGESIEHEAGGGVTMVILANRMVGGTLFMHFPFVVLEEGDALGSAIAIGDFNFDGWQDIAVGLPGKDVAGATDAGMVHVTYPSLIKFDLWRQGN